jgi:hypothetical protein
MSPDWSAKVEPVPYAKLGDPQSLNLYGYMLDSPLDGVDQDGHQEEDLDPEERIRQDKEWSNELEKFNKWSQARDAEKLAQEKAGPGPKLSAEQVKELKDSLPILEKPGLTEHGKQRAQQARQGDAHRDVGDANRVKTEGRTYTDSDTGNTVHVKGNRVVITDSEGNQVTQFKNTRANTVWRVESGKWKPKK